MRIVSSIGEMRTDARRLRRQGRVVGLVPTMGALHEGHLSLVRRAQSECDALVVSIFVNPLQFGPAEDYARYPKSLDRDLELLRPFGVEIVFAPEAAEMYPRGFGTHVEPGPVAEPLEGSARPAHFCGVATVVLKLLNLVEPEAAYFGQKDFQQVMVIRRMVEDLNVGTRIAVCPIVREPDGLALSSRNTYLNPEHRRAAPALYRSLRRAQELFETGEHCAATLLAEMRAVLESEPLAKPEYAAIVDPATMEAVDRVEPGMVALVASRVGAARLIDNLIFGPAGDSDDHLIELALSAAAAG
ncbi:MAG TPA: pantoate--beta-alanine ligase [Terriglobia bacterium]|nr:pantoate--beta-alanine ligase [Terriglobia bacterium]